MAKADLHADQIKQMIADGKSYQEVADATGLARSTVTDFCRSVGLRSKQRKGQFRQFRNFHPWVGNKPRNG